MNLITKYVAPYLKAHLSGLGTAVTLFVADLQNNHGANLTGAQIVALVASALGVAAVVAVSPNTKANVAVDVAATAVQAAPAAVKTVVQDVEQDVAAAPVVTL